MRQANDPAADQTVLIDMLRDRKNRRLLIHDLAMRGEHLTTSAMNVGEIYCGTLSAEERITAPLLESLEIYSISTHIVKTAGSLQFALARNGRTLGFPDRIVAATALEYGLTLMTDNRKDFPIPELKFFDLP